VITNLNITHFSPQNFRKIFGFLRITEKLIKISKNASKQSTVIVGFKKSDKSEESETGEQKRRINF